MGIRLLPPKRQAVPFGSGAAFAPSKQSEVRVSERLVMLSSVVSPFEVYGLAPELRLKETDQTDPAGRYRLLVSGDIIALQRSGGADWTGTARNIISYTYSSDSIDLGLGFNSTNGVLGISARSYDGTVGGQIVLNGHGNGTYPGGVRLVTSSASGAGSNLVIQLTGGTDTGQACFLDRSAAIGAAFTAPPISFQTDTNSGIGGGSDSLQFVLNGTVRVYMGDGVFNLKDNDGLLLGNDLDVNMRIRTSATAANTAVGGMLEGTPVTTASPADSLFISHLTNGADTGIYVSPAGNSYEMLKADASQIGINIMTSANVPANTDIAAGQVRFVVDGADALIVYWNKAGAIKSLTIGTLV